jgi:hypothetical protein
MHPLTLSRPLKNPDPDCADLLTLAERELAAFFSAVKELFGPEHARHSAQDWVHELETMNSLPASIQEWRLITAKVMKQLARRLNFVPAN